MATVSVEPGIDKATLFELIGYTPHSGGQRALHDSTARFRIPCCGRRWGKSQAAGHEITAALFKPNSRWWIVGPTYRLGEKEFRVVFDDIIRKLNLGKYVKKSYNPEQGSMRIEMPWNAVVEVVSAEKQDSLVGEGLDGVILSEAALHKRDTWQMYVEPALTDKRGWALFPSTPRGSNWYEGLYRMGQDAEFPDYESWRFPSWDNPIVYPGGEHDEEMDRIRKVVSGYHFDQEYAAEFTAFEGKIYDELKADVHFTDIEYNPYWKNFWVFDFGFSDPFVCLDIMVDPSDRAYIWREYQVQHKTTMEHGMLLKLRDNPSSFHVDGRFADPRGADEIHTLAPLLGQIVARPVPWLVGVEAVKRAMKIREDGTPGFYIDPRKCPITTRQLQNLRANSVREGRNAREGQHDYDDHGPDAMRYFFSEYFVLGYRGNLSAVYAAGRKMTEGETFFQLHSKMTNEQRTVPF